jgi:hypothetical protein
VLLAAADDAASDHAPRIRVPALTRAGGMTTVLTVILVAPWCLSSTRIGHNMQLRAPLGYWRVLELATRWGTRIHRQGKPSGWSQPQR